MGREKLVIDVDTGVDDAQAIMMALSHTNVDVVAITCVTGNVHVDQACVNTLRVLQACDRIDVPVYKGASLPLITQGREKVKNRGGHHAPDGLGGVPDPNPPDPTLIQEERASTALIRLADMYPGELTLVALAPLTNVALALRLDPEFGAKLKRVVIMGGNIEARGCGVSRCAEFNFCNDPEAVSITLSSLRCPVQVIPFEVCHRTGLPWDWCENALMTESTKRGRFHRTITAYTIHQRKNVLKQPAYLSCDPCAMATALDPNVAVESKRVHCSVELYGELTRGQFVVDWNNLSGNEANVDVVTKIDSAKLMSLFEAFVK